MKLNVDKGVATITEGKDTFLGKLLRAGGKVKIRGHVIPIAEPPVIVKVKAKKAKKKE